jgi:type I restriction enzyme S subunit
MKTPTKTKFIQPEVGIIPEDWEVKKVEDLVTHKKGFAFKSVWFTDAGKRIVKVSDFTGNSIDISKSLFIDKERAMEFRDFELVYQDLVIATVGSWPNNPASIVGKVVKVPKSAEGSLLNQNAVILRVKNRKQIDQLFLFYRLRNSDFSEYIVSGAQGSANQASITLRDIFGFEFGLPPIDERELIVKTLSDLDSKIELNLQMNKTLEAIGQAIFKHWFIDFEFPNEEGKPYKSSSGKMKWSEELMEDIPEAWEIKKLGEVADVNWGDLNTTKDAYTKDGFDAYSASGLDGKMDHFDFDRSGIVLSAIGANCGQTWYATGKWSCIKNTIRVFSCTNQITTEYVFFLTHDENFWPRRGSAQPFISQTDARDVSILIPAKKVVTEFTEIVLNPLNRIEENNKEIRNLAQIRDLLLPKLMSGEIRILVEAG